MDMTPSETLLKTQGLGIQFGGLKAVDALDIEVRKGEIFGLIGPNGAGKSTSFNLLSGALTPTSGRVFFKGEDVTKLKPFDMAKRGLARTFQLTNLFAGLTVIDTMLVGAHLHVKKGLLASVFYTKGYREELDQLRDEARRILATVGLAGTEQASVDALSFVQQRRLEIAMAIATRPTMLLLDEPAAGLSPSETADLGVLIQTLNQQGITIILIEHNTRFVMKLCARICVLDYGRKYAEGSPEEIVANPKVREIYLGRDVKQDHPEEHAHA
ncbi:Lipopolysaccharide export system ATP-binding protein LptB [Pseudoprimorskyibacter insulae]|uniref:Lipopolysaccharide export system ATP-binding protein LptB n=2 Tax=Pseudoprimorskyibacter insulae TaxID=1695997 RepID=A0A2R8AZX5_9RHOB|nr:Lipopolysaccharide export system ATP-binding protein LptB [Pseudoprimorskyibacter insulae]